MISQCSYRNALSHCVPILRVSPRLCGDGIAFVTALLKVQHAYGDLCGTGIYSLRRHTAFWTNRLTLASPH